MATVQLTDKYSMINDLRHWIRVIEGQQSFKTMTRDQFLGNPKIVAKSNAVDLKPNVLVSLRGLPHQPFMDELTAVYDEDGAAIFDGDKVIASYNFGDTLVVDPKYRRRGVGEEMVYQWRMRFPNPASARTRTKASFPCFAD